MPVIGVVVAGMEAIWVSVAESRKVIPFGSPTATAVPSVIETPFSVPSSTCDWTSSLLSPM